MIRVVFDTNILFSAAFKRAGVPAEVLDLVVPGILTACISDAIMAEYLDVLTRPVLRRHAARAREVLELMAEFAVHVSPTRKLSLCSDPDDDCFLECALAAEAAYIVTGNTRHFPKDYGAIAIVTPKSERSAGTGLGRQHQVGVAPCKGSGPGRNSGRRRRQVRQDQCYRRGFWLRIWYRLGRGRETPAATAGAGRTIFHFAWSEVRLEVLSLVDSICLVLKTRLRDHFWQRTPPEQLRLADGIASAFCELIERAGDFVKSKEIEAASQPKVGPSDQFPWSACSI